MILTVTLNPAIDKTIIINNFQEGSVNRVLDTRVDAGGKGINVSKVIKKLNGKTKVLGFIAGKSGESIIEYLNKCNIDHDLVKTKGETRTNIKIVDKGKGIVTDINEKGQEITELELEKLIEKIKENTKRGDILVLAGSIPKGINKSIYKELVSIGNSLGARTFLDADDELLIEGIKGKPYLIKPNIHELEKAYKTKFKSHKDIVEVSKDIIKSGVENVFISLGAEGSLFVNSHSQIYIEALKVDVKNTVGAGDSLVGSIAYAIEKGYSIERALRLSTAMAAFSVMNEGTGPDDISKLDVLEKSVKIKYL